MKINPVIIETFVEQAYRGDILEYMKRKVSDITQDNPELYDAILENTEKVANRLDELLRDGTIASHIQTFVRVNLITACLSIYSVCNAQAEVNELEEMDH